VSAGSPGGRGGIPPPRTGSGDPADSAPLRSAVRRSQPWTCGAHWWSSFPADPAVQHVLHQTVGHLVVASVGVVHVHRERVAYGRDDRRAASAERALMPLWCHAPRKVKSRRAGGSAVGVRWSRLTPTPVKALVWSASKTTSSKPLSANIPAGTESGAGCSLRGRQTQRAGRTAGPVLRLHEVTR
jgi:hypothetical protein